ncbi:MAG: chemotaxis protein CheW [Acidithiobacillus sp.]
MESDEQNDLNYLSKFMVGLHRDQERLRDIQAKYDNLTLLGQMLSAGTDITSMRTDFSALAGILLGQLASELHNKAILNLKSTARIAIDILIRNLFERTADIGFLATDSDIRSYTQACEEDPTSIRSDDPRKIALQTRFREYVNKYSVYHDIILLAPDGAILARLDDTHTVTHSKDPLISASLSTAEAYVETFRPTDLLPGEDSPLIYSYRVMSKDVSRPIGVLCLCFRFQDECQRIFRSLVTESDWTVVTILDTDGRIIASSDIYQFPVGAKILQVKDDECRVTRFAGREYLATTQQTQGYQGYMGPGWQGHSLAPLNHAFEMAIAHEIAQVPTSILTGVLETASLFSSDLRAIPLRAASIQRELNRAVWNGSVWISQDSRALNTSFAKVLLREIGNTGIHTLDVFSQSTTNLYKTVISSVLYNCSLQAALAIDIMDRNLYERANDCRWWAFTRVFREVLEGPDDVMDTQKLGLILRDINRLYTVYHNLLVFDHSAKVIAISNQAYSSMLGKTLRADWVMSTQDLNDRQGYCVSAFEPSDLYAGCPSYIYAAAIPGLINDKKVVGGVAIVFDSAPQLRAMLLDALPRNRDGSLVEGAFAVFAERNGRIVASSDETIAPGTTLPVGREFFDLSAGNGHTNIVEFNGKYYGVGSQMSSGYREYKGETDDYRNDIVALVLVPLSKQLHQSDAHGTVQHQAHRDPAPYRPTGDDTIEVANFYVGSGWYGIPLEYEMEAIDDKHITGIPEAPDWIHGCILYHNHVVPIVDLSTFLPSNSGRASDPQIVVVRVPGQQVYFGFIVDDLGDTREISLSALEAMPNSVAGSTALIESIVKPQGEDQNQQLLMLLSVRHLLERLSLLENVVQGSAL